MTARKLICIVILGGLLLLALTGCTAAYKLDYSGQKTAYFGAKDEYKVGETVDLYYMFVADDTEYTFYLDGEPLSAEYVEGKGYHFSFPMPEHNAVLRFDAKDLSSENRYPTGETLVDFYYEQNGSTGYEELLLYGYNSKEVTLCVYQGDASGQETRTDYLIPVELMDECLALLSDCGLESWESLDEPTSLEGTMIVCKYRKDDGSYVRVSSEQMPEDGEQTLAKIREFLLGCVRPEYII